MREPSFYSTFRRCARARRLYGRLLLADLCYDMKYRIGWMEGSQLPGAGARGFAKVPGCLLETEKGLDWCAARFDVAPRRTYSWGGEVNVDVYRNPMQSQVMSPPGLNHEAPNATTPGN